MATQANLAAATRHGTGKGAARTLRRAGKIPAVIYGHGREPESLEVELAALQRMLAGIAGATTLVDLSVDDRAPVKVLVREVQRNPIRPGDILHVDLYEVRTDEEITVEVPVRLMGTPEGVRHGGVLDQVIHSLELRVLPANLPEHVDIDVSGLGGGRSIFVRDVQVPHAEILNDPDLPICSVVAARAAETPAVETVVAEPELIRKPKAEDEESEG